ncbi:S-adenosyl-L-methionine-dependent methyltransferase [Trametes polyzona]|nr:S-adenosyl-L-methionine-dependent methyltransferase [Trametes polyzona]
MGDEEEAEDFCLRGETPLPANDGPELEQQAFPNHNPTYVTHRVGVIADKLFKNMKFRRTETPCDQEGTPAHVPLHEPHVSDPTAIEWVDEDSPHHTRALIDGVLYKTGDIVIVEQGVDQNRVRAKNAQTERARCQVNRLADTKWFCKISYMFEKIDRKGRPSKWFHAQWLQHGSQTLLQEAAHPRGLFWLNECDDLPMECIYSHCNVSQVWRPGDPAPAESQPTVGENCFYVGLTWDSENCTFVETPVSQIDRALAQCDLSCPCVSCGLQALQEKRKWKCTVGDGGGVTSPDSVDYHINDVVYLHTPGQVSGLLAIAQIIELDTTHLKARVRHYGRYDVVVGYNDPEQNAPVQRDNVSVFIAAISSADCQSQKRLFVTNVFTYVDVQQFAGKAFITCSASPLQVESFTALPDHFYCDLQSESLKPEGVQNLKELNPRRLPECGICSFSMAETILSKECLLDVYGPLRGLELFAGAGGLSTGLEMSGAVQTRWAVEFSPCAAKTFQANHPHATVYNQCTNKLLEHAVETAAGLAPEPLWSLDHAAPQVLPPLPQPGEVDFIFGGPPCQSFSLMNHYKRADDVRSTLVCNMISYVEFYRPMFFLLENVVGMLSCRLDGKQEGQRVTGGIQMGVVKFILGALTALGYQVHFRVLQAGQYGAPQGRRRVIFLGARRDVPLPAFPLPLHAFPSPVHNVNLPTGEVLYPVTRPGADEEGHQCAPLGAVTVFEALNDLVGPFLKRPESFKDLAHAKKRLAAGIAQFTACNSETWHSLPGFQTPEPYPHPPLSRYQSWLRANNKYGVLYHYTPRFAHGVVERVVNVPIAPDAGHIGNRLYDRKTGKPKKIYLTMYGRINGKGQFVTAMTTIAPNAKGGKVIHPEQKRILTVRECARAQGFPDSYRFLSDKMKPRQQIADQLRQIGNAVPVPLSLALGRSMAEALCKLWKSRERGEWDRARSPEVQDA